MAGVDGAALLRTAAKTRLFVNRRFAITHAVLALPASAEKMKPLRSVCGVPLHAHQHERDT